MKTHHSTGSMQKAPHRMKGSLSVVALTFFSLLTAFSACQKTEPATSHANTTNVNSSATNGPSPSASSATANANQATSDAGTSTTTVSLATPTDTYKAGYAARKNKDIALLKRVMAKNALDFLKEIAEADKKTLDDQLKELCEKPQASSAETRNEKISGNRATVEYLNETGKWVVMDFSKEANEWKIDLPKAPGP